MDNIRIRTMKNRIRINKLINNKESYSGQSPARTTLTNNNTTYPTIDHIYSFI
jgi:hypothetical protein